MADEAPNKLCFVVSPIGAPGGPERNHADWLLKGIIEPVFSEHFKEFRVERADKINVPGMINSQVINRLLDANLVIADMSFLNANAFYEMGIRHMKQAPIIHMYREGDKIPFDVAPYRAIPFTLAHPDDLEAAKTKLKMAVEEINKAEYEVENPVTRARGIVRLEEHATPEQRVLLDFVQALSIRVRQLEEHQPFVGAGVNEDANILFPNQDRNDIIDINTSFNVSEPKNNAQVQAIIGFVKNFVGPVQFGSINDQTIRFVAPRRMSGDIRAQFGASLLLLPGVAGINIK